MYLLMILLTVVYLAYLLPRLKKSPDLMHISIYTYLVLAVCVGFDVWVASPGFFRVFTELNLLGLLAYLMVNKGMGKALPLGWLMVWLVTSAAEWYRLLYWQQHYAPPPMVL